MKKMTRFLSAFLAVLTIVLILGVLPQTVQAASIKTPVVTVSNDPATGKITLTWKAVSGAEKYEIYRATSEKGTYSRRTSTTNTTYTDKNATAGQKYYYYVKAISSQGSTAKSKIVTRTCDLARPVVTLSNVASSGKIKVSWKKIDGAAKYEVWRATSKTGTYQLMKTTTGTSYTNTSATAGKTYYYKVNAIAEKSAANSAYSEVKSRTCDLRRPEVTLSNVASSGKIKVSWKKIDGATKYEVYRATSSDGTYKLLKTVTGTSLTNTSASAEKTYYYKVRAIAEKSAANSAYSEVKSRTCDLARSNPKIQITDFTGYPMLHWDRVQGAQKYKIYCATSKNGTYSLLTTTTSVIYNHTSAEVGTTYYYKIKAIAKNSAANSAYSAVLSCTCDLAYPDLKVTNVASTGYPKLTWDAIKGAEKYSIYRATSKNGTYSLMTTTTSTSYTNTSAKVGTTYYYKVKALAKNSDADSAYSPAKSCICILPRPTLSVSLNSRGEVCVTWNPVKDATRYNVYRATSANGPYSLFASNSSTSTTNTTVTEGETYYYRAVAVAQNPEANSAYSEVQSITIPEKPNWSESSSLAIQHPCTFFGCRTGENQMGHSASQEGDAWLVSCKFDLDTGREVVSELISLYTEEYPFELTHTSKADFTRYSAAIFYRYNFDYTGSNSNIDGFSYSESVGNDKVWVDCDMRISIYYNFRAGWIMVSVYTDPDFELEDLGDRSSKLPVDFTGSSDDDLAFATNPNWNKDVLPCTACDGSRDCSKCNASGYLWSSASDSFDRNCWRCNNSGICQTCHGTGFR